MRTAVGFRRAPIPNAEDAMREKIAKALELGSVRIERTPFLAV